MRLRIISPTCLLVILFFVGCHSNTRIKRIVGGKTAQKISSGTGSPPTSDNRPSPPSRPSSSNVFNTTAYSSAPVAFMYDKAGAIISRVLGKVESSAEPEFFSFKGIRYAEPPVGRFRFQRPRKIPMVGDIEARMPGPPCVQIRPTYPFEMTGTEDCLFLNVFTPQLPEMLPSNMIREMHCKGGTEDTDDDNTLLPVMVWNHGGGYRTGSANQYGPKHLVTKGIVVVTIQYRLGPLGFLCHNDKNSPGNAALFDQLAALEWVQEHIMAFGGDPKKVSFAGHDAGASAAMMLSQAKNFDDWIHNIPNISQGLFRSVVAMSGSSLSAWATEDNPKRSANVLAKSVGCPTDDTAEAVRCLQQISARDLMTKGLEAMIPDIGTSQPDADLRSIFSSSAPVVDGKPDVRFLPTVVEQRPKEGLEAGLIKKIPLLTGITRDETSNMFTGKQKADILQKMKEIPGYLDQIFLPNLAKTTKGLVNLTNILSDTLTEYFSKLPFVSKELSLGKLIEATSDALFALPAFLTSSLWGRSGGPVYLYSFDHPSPYSASIFSSAPFKSTFEGSTDGESARTRDALEERDEEVGHGEDLFYLFEPKSINGKELPGFKFTRKEDEDVLELLTTTVAQFVKTGNPSLELEGQESGWLPFSEELNNYLSISSKPKVGTEFKFCQMGLWGGIPNRLFSAKCKDFLNPLSLLPTFPSGFPGIFGGNTGTQQPNQKPKAPIGGLNVPLFG